MGEEWGNYYHNIEKNDIIEVFERYNYMFKWSYLEVKGPDIRFWGVMNEVTNHSFKIAWGVSDHAIIIKTIAEGLNKAGVLNRYLELGLSKHMLLILMIVINILMVIKIWFGIMAERLIF